MKKLFLFTTLCVSYWTMASDTIAIHGIYYMFEEANAIVTRTPSTGEVYKGYIIIPDSVTDLQGTIFPVTTIGGEAFQGCGIDSVIIPSTISSIKDKAFESCSSLKNISVYNSNPPQLGTDVFSNGASRAVLYVPQSAVNTYRRNNSWKVFQNVKPLEAKPHEVAIDTTSIDHAATLTWDSVPTATLYQMHLYTSPGSKIAFDTTLNFSEKGELVSAPIRQSILDQGGSIIIGTIGPFSVSVVSTDATPIEMNYNMKVYDKNSQMIQQEQSSFTLQEHSSPTGLYRIALSAPDGVYDLHGRCYPTEQIGSLPQGVYIVIKQGYATKYSRTY